MNKKTLLMATVALMIGGSFAKAQSTVKTAKEQNAAFKATNDLMTPEALWAMGRIGGASSSPDGNQVVYQVGYYSVNNNNSQQMLFVTDVKGSHKTQLTTGSKSETDAVWIQQGKKIAFLTGGQLWIMNPDGSNRKKLTNSTIDTVSYTHLTLPTILLL